MGEIKMTKAEMKWIRFNEILKPMVESNLKARRNAKAFIAKDFITLMEKLANKMGEEGWRITTVFYHPYFDDGGMIGFSKSDRKWQYRLLLANEIHQLITHTDRNPKTDVDVHEVMDYLGDIHCGIIIPDIGTFKENELLSKFIGD